VDRIPLGYELARVLNTTDPDLVLLDLLDLEVALECAREIRARFPEKLVIGMAEMTAGMIAGRNADIAAVVPFPPESDALMAGIEQAFHQSKNDVEENLIAFLPSKAGSGATTVVLNTAVAFAASMKKKVLVLEADLRSGVLSVMLNAQPSHSLQEALQAASELDALRIPSLVHSAYGVDWLLSTRSLSGSQPNWYDYFHLLDHVRARYDLILTDLPELVNPATREIVRRAKWVFNVCTPEILPLRLAEQRFRELEQWGVSEERVQVLLNRWTKTELSAADVTEHLKRPVLHVFPNDYRAVRSALLDGRPVSQDSALWRECTRFTALLTGRDDSEKPLHAKLMSLFR
jgi:pilus assembly protein CpaE